MSGFVKNWGLGHNHWANARWILLFLQVWDRKRGRKSSWNKPMGTSIQKKLPAVPWNYRISAFGRVGFLSNSKTPAFQLPVMKLQACDTLTRPCCCRQVQCFFPTRFRIGNWSSASTEGSQQNSFNQNRKQINYAIYETIVWVSTISKKNTHYPICCEVLNSASMSNKYVQTAALWNPLWRYCIEVWLYWRPTGVETCANYSRDMQVLQFHHECFWDPFDKSHCLNHSVPDRAQ